MSYQRKADTRKKEYIDNADKADQNGDHEGADELRRQARQFQGKVNRGLMTMFGNEIASRVFEARKARGNFSDRSRNATSSAARAKYRDGDDGDVHASYAS